MDINNKNHRLLSDSHIESNNKTNEMKHLKILFLILSVLLLISASCKKNKDCRRNYNLQFHTTISPNSHEINLGDSVWIELTFTPSGILDLNSNELIDSKDFDFLLQLLIMEFDSTSYADALSSFEFGANKGDIQIQPLVTVNVLNLSPIQEDQQMAVSFFAKPSKTGNYLFAFATQYIWNDPVEFIDSNCKEFLELSFNTNGGDNKYNYEFYISNSNDVNTTEEGFNRTGGFAFTVVE